MALVDKYKLYYTQMTENHQDELGFIDTKYCDSTLWSGLVGCIQHVDVDLLAARDDEGAWHRRPIGLYPECFPIGSSSTISRDMLLGVAWWSYFNDRPDVLEDVIKYALQHCFIMGKGKAIENIFGQAFFTPTMYALYARLVHAMGYKKHYIMKWVPVDVGGLRQGFQAHLQVLSIFLTFIAEKKISNKNKQVILAHAKRQPANALFLTMAYYLTGDVSYAERAKKILKQKILFPENRLPTTHDRYASWLWQRDYSSDWKPDYEIYEEHHGGDFLFCYALLYGHMKKEIPYAR